MPLWELALGRKYLGTLPLDGAKRSLSLLIDEFLVVKQRELDTRVFARSRRYFENPDSPHIRDFYFEIPTGNEKAGRKSRLCFLFNCKDF